MEQWKHHMKDLHKSVTNTILFPLISLDNLTWILVHLDLKSATQLKLNCSENKTTDSDVHFFINTRIGCLSLIRQKKKRNNSWCSEQFVYYTIRPLLCWGFFRSNTKRAWNGSHSEYGKSQPRCTVRLRVCQLLKSNTHLTESKKETLGLKQPFCFRRDRQRDKDTFKSPLSEILLCAEMLLCTMMCTFHILRFLKSLSWEDTYCGRQKREEVLL